ncbi:SDR family oxidoreductase [Pseudoalteromonas sp. JBTF-M23]|uniref:SDR family oxidoreductase n=1 Tax=Pseudoalteromonas caenipelagi TaxID=2726988 RepID=A0A849VI06_9GAMM|nr:SDR family oxidoreductase [Pseudoalteromonas caenipelagi]NOU51361.1 SDR family oxidoreductase [Pseudoalteromonas caenipelagi]
MSNNQDKKLIVVTGANKGLGFETAKQLAELGHHVVLTARNEQAGKAACRLLAEQGLEADFIQLDISDSSSIKTFTETLADRYQHVDVLINNAGVFFDWESSAATLKLDELSDTLKTNLFGTIEITQSLLPVLGRASAAKVINVSSDLGSVSFASDSNNEYYGVNGTAYRISKAALNMYSTQLAKEYAQSNLVVSVVSPGWCQTDMGTNAAPRSAEQGARSIVDAALEPANKYHGKFVLDSQFLAW